MATELLIRVQGTHLVPGTAGDQELIDGLPQGKEFVAKLTSASKRSILQNRFYWKLLGVVVENQEFYRAAEQLHFWLKIKLGYVEHIEFHDNRMVTRVASTSFERMDSDDFKRYLDAAITVICEEIIPGMESAGLVHEVEHMLGLSYDALWQRRAA
ncbi:hypothetical protein I6F35_33435 [Bradyrhizobium sp. BRP22]|uniref:hypothetical protein n=1 Tax=Bradyrhizobium sp. BRP22 TaxID=2793821 RepID=UPI001CD7BCC8|nr:hypothetical protein [Bradyrhizobium sp. BRP22]MCA1458038.1 hypothetical protein [Bradyrhizobium sp. BRP22]